MNSVGKAEKIAECGDIVYHLLLSVEAQQSEPTLLVKLSVGGYSGLGEEIGQCTTQSFSP